jgi:lipopolysaccharide export system protein LptA
MGSMLAIAMIVLSAGAAAQSNQIHSFNVETNASAVNVEGADFKAVAQRMSYDAANGNLVLEGSTDSPAEINQIHGIEVWQTTARKITLSLKSGRVDSEGVRLFHRLDRQQ